MYKLSYKQLNFERWQLMLYCHLRLAAARLTNIVLGFEHEIGSQDRRCS